MSLSAFLRRRGQALTLAAGAVVGMLLVAIVIPKAAGTDIIRFRPHLEPRLVTSTTPVEPIDVAPGHAPGRRG